MTFINTSLVFRVEKSFCKLEIQNVYNHIITNDHNCSIHILQVVMDNGILQVTLSKPDGIVTGICYNGIDNLLEVLNEEENRGYMHQRIL